MSDMSFKFGVGGVVKHVISANQSDYVSDKRGFVIERIWQECPGGVQRHYVIRWCSPSGILHTELMKCNEVELVASETFKDMLDPWAKGVPKE